jgi:hypothetical protein
MWILTLALACSPSTNADSKMSDTTTLVSADTSSRRASADTGGQTDTGGADAEELELCGPTWTAWTSGEPIDGVVGLTVEVCQYTTGGVRMWASWYKLDGCCVPTLTPEA